MTTNYKDSINSFKKDYGQGGRFENITYGIAVKTTGKVFSVEIPNEPYQSNERLKKAFLTEIGEQILLGNKNIADILVKIYHKLNK